MTEIELQHVSKKYGNKTVLKDINLTLQSDTIYALLGRNGVGKTTLMRLITGQVVPTSGNILLDGEDLLNNEERLNQVYLMSTVNLYPIRSTIQWVMQTTDRFFGGFDWERALRLLTTFGLESKQRLRQLSTGQQTLVRGIIALCVPCAFVFLDEPVLGLDAPNREIFYAEIVQAYSDRSRTFVIATHLIEEIAQLVSHVVVIADGQVQLDMASEELERYARIVTGPAHAVDDYLQEIPRLATTGRGAIRTVTVMTELPAGHAPAGVVVRAVPLQDLFITLTTGGDQDA